MSQLHYIELFAGVRPDGESVAERLQVKPLDKEEFELVRSPAFVKGIAAGDVVKLNEQERSFELLKRAGNLCIRVFAQENIKQLSIDMTPLIEKLGGELDLENDRLLVYSIHVSCGFSMVEKILNDHVGDETQSMWMYGNVYDPQDGETPLNWWQEILNEK